MSDPEIQDWIWLVPALKFRAPHVSFLGCLGFGDHDCKQNFVVILSVAMSPIAKHSWADTVISPLSRSISRDQNHQMIVSIMMHVFLVV